MNSMNNKIDYIVGEILERINQCKDEDTILVEASGRHVHLSKKDVETLFGEGYELTKKRDLSQPGQYLCEEKVMVIGPRGVLQAVSVLGPARAETQVELSKSDAVSVGINAPVRMSGDIKNSGSCIIATQKAAIKLEEGVIAAMRHIHITPEDAEKFNVANGEIVGIELQGERGLIFNKVAVRVSPKFNTAIHLDYDEANACGFTNGIRAKIIK
ncbi:Propanediol utilization protein [Clostridium collagenovorans DSM 3089]|uniref:Phosphate propanoyltransferase n=2 Tax=Clostridium TaxID=1485 RepID=A0A1M5TCN4_9CLOT|nr:Propanediol utilization protein [Clostridium collagenovorans DSM 3089]